MHLWIMLNDKGHVVKGEEVQLRNTDAMISQVIADKLVLMEQDRKWRRWRIGAPEKVKLMPQRILYNEAHTLKDYGEEAHILSGEQIQHAFADKIHMIHVVRLHQITSNIHGCYTIPKEFKIHAVSQFFEDNGSIISLEVYLRKGYNIISEQENQNEYSPYL